MTNASTEHKSISFIIPALNEENNLQALYDDIRENVEKLGNSWEVIFIDHGSTDGTWYVMQKIARLNDGHVRAYKYPVHRGRANALALGYNEARGDVVFTMHAALRDELREIPRFLSRIDAGHDIVTGSKRESEGLWRRLLPRRIHNAVSIRLEGLSLDGHNDGFRAYRKTAVKSLPVYGNTHQMVSSPGSFKGYNTAELEFEHHPRSNEVSKGGWISLIIGASDKTKPASLPRLGDCPMHFAGKAATVVAITMMLLATVTVVASLGFGYAAFVIIGMISCPTFAFFTMAHAGYAGRDNLLETYFPVCNSNLTCVKSDM